MLIKYYLEFDACGGGSPEHYFHFMHGYLLPSLFEINNIESSTNLGNAQTSFHFRSCGPVMDKILSEVLTLYELDYEIVQKAAYGTGAYSIKLRIPRWDMWLMSAKIDGKHTDHPNFLDTMMQVKRDINSRIDRLQTALMRKTDFNGFLILKRSKQPKFYERGGESEIPTYGTGRRELIGIETAVNNLTNENIPVKIFEPGKHSFIEQVQAFQNCKGIIGVRGAEFANIIWMNRKSKVILIQPSNMGVVVFQKSLAEILDLNYIEIPTDETHTIKLDHQTLLSHLN
ncbi:MAG: glycosyltransferase family 61 protein [Proteobacteria bacterium]|nr:glycosyltransferase family 61 protein [Pseudomonadota bacterium]